MENYNNKNNQNPHQGGFKPDSQSNPNSEPQPSHEASAGNENSQPNVNPNPNPDSINLGPVNPPQQPQQNEPQPQFQPPQEPPQQPPQESQPQPAAAPVNPVNPIDPAGQPKKSGLSGWLMLLIVVVLGLYFSGAWDWFGSIGTTPDNNNEEQQSEGLPSEGVEGAETGEEGNTAIEVPVGKGHVTFAISAGIPLGAALTSGNLQPNLEIRRISLHNPFRESWVLIYDGIRPLNLTELSASGEKHELISTNLLALDYDKVRIEFVDLFAVNQRNGQNVTRSRVVDMPGISIKGGEQNMVEIFFNIEDPYLPVPVLR